MEDRLCQHCHQKLQGKKGQKFCTDLCRSRYHYNIKAQDNNSKFISGVNKTLVRNWRLLKKLNTEGKTLIRKLDLERGNFDFRFFTHVYQNASGNTYYFCYDQGYLFKTTQEVLLVKQEMDAEAV